MHKNGKLIIVENFQKWFFFVFAKGFCFCFDFVLLNTLDNIVQSLLQISLI